MRLIDADAVFPMYMEMFKGKIEPHEVRFSMNDIRDNLWNIPTIEPNATQRTQHVESVESVMRLEDDGTLWVAVDDCDKMKRVIVESGTWCKTFGDPMRWIPVDEKPPECKNDMCIPDCEAYESDPCLVTYDNGNEVKVSVGMYQNYIDEPESSGWASHIDYRVENVTAWMPLPKPYKGGAE